MKIRIDKNQDYVKLHFDRDEHHKRPSMEVWLKIKSEKNSLESVFALQNWTLLDGSMTIRRFYGDLFFYNEAFPPLHLRMDVDKLIAMLLKLPMTEQWVEHYPLTGKVEHRKGIGTVVIDTDKFRNKNREIVMHSWVTIGKWVTKPAIQNILNAHKIGLSRELKPLLSSFVGKAEVFPDCGSKYSFTFDGINLGLGYNGGIICHGVGENTFSVELNPSNKPHYSIHT